MPIAIAAGGRKPAETLSGDRKQALLQLRLFCNSASKPAETLSGIETQPWGPILGLRRPRLKPAETPSGIETRHRRRGAIFRGSWPQTAETLSGIETILRMRRCDRGAEPQNRLKPSQGLKRTLSWTISHLRKSPQTG